MPATESAEASIPYAQRLEFESRGFLHLKQLFDPDLTARMLAAYERAARAHIDPVRRPGAEIYDIDNVLDQDPVFIEIAVHPRLLPYLLTTIGDDVQLIQATARLFPPGPTFTAPWHSDMADTLGIDAGNSINFRAKVHFFFEDLRPDQGCLAFLPGTHRRSVDMPRPDPRDIDTARDAVVIVPKAGDAVLFNTHCLHMCLDNSSGIERRTLIYSYSHFWVKQFPGAQPSNLVAIPDGPLERQIFGIGHEGVEPFNQRPWKLRKLSRIERARRILARTRLWG